MAPRQTIEMSIAGLRQRLTEIKRFHDETQDEAMLSQRKDEIALLMTDLQTTWDACLAAFYEICDNWKEEQRNQHPFFENDELEVSRKLFREARLKLHRLQSHPASNASSALSNAPIGESHLFASAGRLERIAPPTFDGTRSQWLGFKHSFQSMVINTSMSKTDKLNYLKKSLTGNIAGILKNLPASETNFDRAWEELIKRYDNSRLLKQAHVFALMQIQATTRPNNIQDYERILNQVHENLMSLEDLGVKVSAWRELLLALVQSKFDDQLLDDWERYLSNLEVDVTKKTDPGYEEFKSYVLRRVDACASRPKAGQSNKSDNQNRNNHKKNVTRAHVTSSQPCLHCSENHSLFKCPKFRNLSVEQRFDFVKSKRVCFNCLRQNHMAQECQSKSCTICDKRHNTLLHYKRKHESEGTHRAGRSADGEPPLKKLMTSANEA